MSPDYSIRDVKLLVEGYAELREAKATHGPGLRFLCELADLDGAISHMPPKEYHAVLLHGLLALPLREAADALAVAPQTVLNRYDAGVTWLTNYLNGEAT